MLVNVGGIDFVKANHILDNESADSPEYQHFVSENARIIAGDRGQWDRQENSWPEEALMKKSDAFARRDVEDYLYWGREYIRRAGLVADGHFRTV